MRDDAAGSGPATMTSQPSRYLHLIAFTSGAAVMALELLGTRLLAPVCGMSIHVWAAMITVTLASVAVGYAHGGKAADEASDARPLGHLLLAAGVSVGVLAACAQPVLRLLAPIDLRVAALLGSLVLFGFPLACLGAAMPLCVKLATPRAERIGRAVGSIYLASTVGSCVGTLVAGFVLIPAVGTLPSLIMVAVGLSAIGAGGTLRRWWARVLALAAIVLTGTALGWPALMHLRESRKTPLCMDGRKQLGLASLLYLADYDSPRPQLGAQSVCTALAGGGARKAFEKESLSGRVEVWTVGSQRLLVVDGMLQTAMPVDFRSAGARHHLFPEKYWLELLPYFRPQGHKALLIGLGGGLLPRVFEGYEIDTYSVEADAAVVAMARRWFGHNGAVATADGRRYLQRTDEKYDFVVLDAFSGDSPPSHLLTREAFEEARAVLSPGGILAVHVVDIPARGEVVGAIQRTLRPVLRRVLALGTDGPEAPQMVTVFASDGDLDLQTIPHGPSWQASAQDLKRALTFAVPLDGQDHYPVLLDDRNPFDVLYAPVAVEWRKRTGDLLAH